MNGRKRLWEQIETIVKKILICVLNLFHKELKESFFQTVMQFVKFGLVGISNTFISYMLNIAVLMMLQPAHVSWDFVVGNIVAFVLSVLWSFYWNNKFVFTVQENKKRSIVKSLLKTYISYGFTGILLSNLLSWMWISVFRISKYIAPLINLIVSVPINFVVNKLWAFK